MDFLVAFNAVVGATASRKVSGADAKDYDDSPDELGIDSLDMVMVVAVLTDAYGIPRNAQFDNSGKFTIADLRDYVDKHKTQEPESVENLLEFV
jgi:acyl carrier protein